MKKLIWMFVTCVISVASAQTIKVDLKRLTYLDDGGGMIDFFRKTPVIPIKLPSVDTTGARFVKFYSFWKQKKGPWAVIMIVPQKDGEKLYIDHNYNNDLSDDGPPRFFPKKENTFTYDMVNNEDKRQYTPEPEKARKFIKDSSITWPQIVLEKELERKFKVAGYPTNILIVPDGREVYRTMRVEDHFFKDNMKN